MGQLATAEQSNEITSIPKLLDQIEIESTVVTIDAADCQKAIADKIITNGGDYASELKDNQGKLNQSVVDYVIEQMENDYSDVKSRRYIERCKGYGRKDEITYYQLAFPNDLLRQQDCNGLRTIGVLIRHSESTKYETDEVRYDISSLPIVAYVFTRAFVATGESKTHYIGVWM